MNYLDNAATSYPKQDECLRRALERYLELGASPGRGGYDRAVQAEALVSAIRCDIARFFGAGDDARVCFAANATDALNILIQGMVRPGDHVVSSRLEHNSVLRPLNHLRRQGLISLDLLPFDAGGFVDPAQVAACLEPQTRMVVMTHASNVLGTIQPVSQVGAICREHGIPLVVDVAQSAGCVPVDMRAWGIQAIAFTGHKSLLGPTGIGGLVIRPGLDPVPTRFGGTGIDSADPFHPLAYPQRLEAGTVNLLGILCLGECLQYLRKQNDTVLAREMRLLEKLRDGLRASNRIRLYAADHLADHLPLLTCTVQGIASTDVGDILDGDFGIAVRTGLHCAPLVHEALGTLHGGAVRFSLGPFTTEEQIDAAIAAMSAIAGR